MKSKKRKLQYDGRKGRENYYVQIRRSGKRKQFNLGPNKREAEKKLVQLEKEIDAGRISFNEHKTTQLTTADGRIDMHVKELAVRHLEWVKENREHSTFENRQNFVLQFLDFVGDVTVLEINRQVLEEFYKWAKKRNNGANSG